jgi:hypothetical protein
MTTVVVSVAEQGGQRWLWLTGLSAVTIFAGTLLGLFMRNASRSMNVSTRGVRH